MDYKVGEEIKILYDVFLPLSLCIKKFILASATNYFSTFCWTTVLDLCYLCCVLVIMQKEKRSWLPLTETLTLLLWDYNYTLHKCSDETGSDGKKRTILQGHGYGSKSMWAKLIFIWRLFSNRVWMPPRIDSVFELLTNVVLQLKPCPSGLKLRRHGSRSFVLSQPFSVCNSLCLWGNWFNATFLASFLPIIARAKAALLVRLSFAMLA